MDIPKNYNPKDFEPRINAFWLQKELGKPNTNSRRGERFTIVIPPPNITAVLHVGHALNNLIQDVVIRRKRMQGFETLWLPGTDHAGIATQNMVEKHLVSEGTSREAVGRAEFERRLWAWKNDKGDRIIEQLQEIGCSCDWSRTRFTLEPTMSATVREIFVSLYEEGLIYRGKYIINWCPRCKTALADDEVEHVDEDGKLWHLKYPLVENENEYLVVATTRPETMLGDTAVAVHPEDERYKHLIGKKLRLPLAELRRKGVTFEGAQVDVAPEIPIVGDWEVSREFGTGAVKVTPAHDPNDYWIGKRHDLALVLAIDENGNMNENAGEYRSLDRYAARKAIVQKLDELGLLLKIDKHSHAVGHCYRCHSTIEPYLSSQWFVKMKPLARPALEIVKRGKVKFVPQRWEGVYFNWMNNIRDWCISRQLWWGHQIPVWYGEDDTFFVARTEEEALAQAREHYRKQDITLRRDPDVLDTWFSSWLWPFATLGWQEQSPDFARYYPTDNLITAPEIIFFWVARMIMAGEHFCGELPFDTVYIHGTVRDPQGRKMSKSLGNGIDPLDVVEQYGRDALRFTLISQAGAGQDLFIDMKSFEHGRNFTNKLWNASRMLLLNIGEDRFTRAELDEAQPNSLPSKWIFSRFAATVAYVNDACDSFRFDELVKTLHNFFWAEFCDWYLEAIKPTIANSREEKIAALSVFEKLLRIMHPVLPYLTEELRNILGTVVEGLVDDDNLSIMVAEFPEKNSFSHFIDDDAENSFGILMQLIAAARNLKAEAGLGTTKAGIIVAVIEDCAIAELCAKNAYLIESIARIEKFELAAQKPDGACGNAALSCGAIFLPLAGIIDIDKEKARLGKEISKLEGALNGIERKLADENFCTRAPKEVLEAERVRKGDYEAKLAILRAQLGAL